MEWLNGKKTYVGLLIALVGIVGQMFPGVQEQTTDASNILALVQANWENIVAFVGLLIAAYGRAVARFQSPRSL